MRQVRCTNCGCTALIPDESGEFCKCEACGSSFNVPKASAFSKVELDHTQDVRAWREYLLKQLRLQQESSKARDYGGVKLFAQKILSVLPDDFCAQYYVALADRCEDNDTAYVDFLAHADFTGATPDEIREVADSAVATVTPKYIDDVKAFIARAYPDGHAAYDAPIERNIKNHIQKLKLAASNERDVFICHRTAAPDQDVADAICTRLEERGLRCWIAPRNILAGSQNYERDIIKGVENCRLFLFVSSFKSIYSEDCEKELRAAVLADKVLYSYRIDDTEYDGAFSRALSPVQWLDASDDPYAHLEQLVIDVKGMLAEDEREKAELEEKRFATREKERRLLEEQRAREKERLERLERIVSSGAVAAPASNYRSRLKRAEIEINSGNFDHAVTVLDEVLDCDPENPLAWWLLLLCDYRVTTDAKLADLDKDFTVNANYKNAERFADGAMKGRIEKTTDGYRVRVIKSVNAALEHADAMYAVEDFRAVAETLDKCASVFSDDEGMIFKRFPDVASRYYWLRLWAKYGQTSLVCVEDITRESEYKQAMRYASPAQAAEYERARETVSKNAQLFLRERSKNSANDSKLVDYLVDNKNILPVDTYNYYSSLLYFRKMLAQLNMTETQLRSSTVDISTNEYFMLAQSLATAEQKTAYDELAATLDGNRESKQRQERQARERRELAKKREAARAATVNRTRNVFTVITAIAAYVLFIAAVIVFFEAVNGAAFSDDFFDYDEFGLLSSEITAPSICFLLSSVFRMLNEACVLTAPQEKRPIALSYIDLALSVATIPIMSVLFGRCVLSGVAASAFVFAIMSAVIDGIAVAKNKKQKIDKR